MNSEFELIHYSGNLPARIEIKQGKIEVSNHWHKEIELVYVLDGEVQINVNSVLHTVGADDFLLLNSAENHSLSAENAKCLILDISYEFAQQYDASLYNNMFEIGKGSGAEEEIRSLLWQMSRTVNDEELPALRQYAIITELLHVLFVQCRRKKPEPAANDTHYAVSIIKAGGEISGRSSNN